MLWDFNKNCNVLSKSKQNIGTTHSRINLNGLLERAETATGVNRNIIAKIQIIEYALYWKKKQGVPVPTASEHTIPENFSSAVRQVLREIFLEPQNQREVKDFDLLNLFT